MKVHSLWLGEYRVLRDIEIQFSPDPRRSSGRNASASPGPGHALDLLVGVNGTGKSTALRALVEVLKRIAGNPSAADILFRITFERKPEELITITNVDEGNGKLAGKFRVRIGDDDQDWELDDVRQYAPPRYVTYTTGREDGREAPDFDVDVEVLADSTQGAYWLREHRGDTLPAAEAEDPVSGSGQGHFEITAHDLPLVTLCGLLQASVRPGGAGIVSDAFDALGITRLSAFNLRFRIEPGAGGRHLNDTITALRRAAPRTRVQGSWISFVFDVRDRSAEVLGSLQAAFGAESPVGLFRELSVHSRSQAGFRPVLPRVELFIERKPVSGDGAPVPDLHTYEWLSDGERTFLARMCMLALFGAEDALILMDEPEVHFNDYWKRKLVRLVDRALEGNHSHAIITTHSSIVLTDARKGQITVLDRSEDGYTRQPLKPGVPTFGADPSDVLIHVFGAEAAAGAKSVDEVRDVLARYERGLRSKMERSDLRLLHTRLEELQKELGPGYWRFKVADALSRWPKADAPQA